MTILFDLMPARPMPQAQDPIVPVTLREICEQSDRFNISPTYQREDVWTRRESQQLIDTILQGKGIGLLEGYKYLDKGKSYWEIMDGHQRISSIVRFYQGEYKTWTETVKRKMQPTSKSAPVEPSKHFEELSGYLKDYFLDYHVSIIKTDKMTPEERATRFLCIQCHKPLTPSERLNVFPSKANSIANDVIAKHSFWEDFYIGEFRRKQIYLSSLYLLGVQVSSSGIVDLRSGNFIPNLASGQFDSKITDDIVRTVQDRLDAMLCVYSGIQFTDRAASIAMYQSIMFLERAGCVIQSSTHKGILANWINSAIDSSKHASGLPVYHRPIHTLLYASGQRNFWAKHLKAVMTLFGIKGSYQYP